MITIIVEKTDIILTCLETDMFNYDKSKIEISERIKYSISWT